MEDVHFNLKLNVNKHFIYLCLRIGEPTRNNAQLHDNLNIMY